MWKRQDWDCNTCHDASSVIYNVQELGDMYIKPNGVHYKYIVIVVHVQIGQHSPRGTTRTPPTQSGRKHDTAAQFTGMDMKHNIVCTYTCKCPVQLCTTKQKLIMHVCIRYRVQDTLEYLNQPSTTFAIFFGLPIRNSTLQLPLQYVYSCTKFIMHSSSTISTTDFHCNSVNYAMRQAWLTDRRAMYHVR